MTDRLLIAPTPVRTERRWLDGATVDVTLYSDGQIRFVVDHPSNDPATEMEIGAKVTRLLLDAYESHGQPAPTLRSLIWRDDA